MEEKIEYFVEVEEDEECKEQSVIDSEYEFEASRFFDFSRSETASEALEAERWFDVSGNYPPSPFIAKSMRGSDIPVEQQEEKTTGTCSMSQETPEAKSKSTPKLSKQRSSTSTLMKPTASYLAKQKHAQKLYSTQICTRLHKVAANKSDEQSSCGSDHLATKRQKLEIGYLCKRAHLKHQAPMLRKLSKKGGSSVAYNSVMNSKLMLTVPKQPELETLRRAQIRRSNNGVQSSEHQKQKTSTIKARPLNKKLSSHHTANHAIKLSTAVNSKRPKAQSAKKQEKSEMTPQTKSCLPNRNGEHHALCQNTREETTIQRESKSSSNERFLLHPPTELFNKMSLKPETISQPKLRLSGKGMKENAPDPLRHESSKSVGKQNHSGLGGVTSKIAYHPSINRKLGIR